uniref:Xylose isomerase-like TIM barrel domain-containing protein n=1 Tax=Panagrolaimus sp. ES5 TaxID=591445 RepID=A0AC34GXH8_9BILA
MVKRVASTAATSTVAAATVPAKVPRKIKKEIIDDKETSSSSSLPDVIINSAESSSVRKVGKKVKKEMVTVEKVKIEKSDREDTKVVVKTEIEGTAVEETNDDHEKKTVKKAVRKTKVKVEKPAWSESLKAEYESTGKSVLSSVGVSQKYLGAHVSASGGVENAVYNAMAIGCRSFALFLKNQRRWDSKPIEEASIESWHAAIKETGFDLKMIVPHGSYLLNAGSPNAELREKTKASILDEIRRCEKLGVGLYNFHPGSSCDEIPKDKRRMAENAVA